MYGFEKELSKYKSSFNRRMWILRLLTMTIALASVIYFLREHNAGRGILLEVFNQTTQPTKLDSTGRPLEMTIPVYRKKTD